MGRMWRVRMLGALQANSDGLSISRFRTRRVGLLLAYLAYNLGQSHPREKLADLLWPDVEPDRANASLRQALASLRRHLEPPGVPAGAIVYGRQSMVCLNPEYVTTDVADFSHATSTATTCEEWGRAIDLYTGELLPGFYEDWVLQERLCQEDRLVSALLKASKSAEADQNFGEAIRFTRLAIQNDNLNEALHADLMRLCLASGRVEDASPDLTTWKSSLSGELGVEVALELDQMVEHAPVLNPGQKPWDDSGILANLEETRPEGNKQPSSRMPIQFTKFFGRSKEIEQVLDAFLERSARLVTLTGPAGVGKTRLSLQVGQRLRDERGWNVWFVSLADISDGAHLVEAILAVIQIKTWDREPIQVLADRFREGQNLLILDNLEHLLEAAHPPIVEILKHVTGAAILVTSRQCLKLGGEQEVNLSPLPVPDVTALSNMDLAEIGEAASVQLFVDRSQAVLSDFQLTAHNALSVVQICWRLEGLPLALEIGAGLSSAFTPSQLQQSLEHRLDILKSRRRDLPDRHQSVNAAIDYSYNLLSEPLKRLFVDLSVFRGGFTLSAAQSVCLPASTADDALSMLLDLQERSLLKSDRGEGTPRFSLFESYREYGRQLLDEPVARLLEQRHAAYFTKCSVEKTLFPEDRANRSAAVRFLVRIGAVSQCLDLLFSFEDYTVHDRDIVQGLAGNHFDDVQPADQIRLLTLQADAEMFRSDLQASLETCEKALALAKQFGQSIEIGRCRRKVGLLLSYLNRREEAIAYSEEDLAEAVATEDHFALQTLYTTIGMSYRALGKFPEALFAHQKSVEASKALHQGEVYWPVIYNLSMTKYDLGRLDEGLELAYEGLRKAKSTEEEFGITMCIYAISRYHFCKQDFPAALAVNYESLRRRRTCGFVYWRYHSIYHHSAILLEMGAHSDSATLLAASFSVAKSGNLDLATNKARLKSLMKPSEFEKAWIKGSSMDLEEAFSFASQFK